MKKLAVSALLTGGILLCLSLTALTALPNRPATLALGPGNAVRPVPDEWESVRPPEVEVQMVDPSGLPAPDDSFSIPAPDRDPDPGFALPTPSPDLDSGFVIPYGPEEEPMVILPDETGESDRDLTIVPIPEPDGGNA